MQFLKRLVGAKSAEDFARAIPEIAAAIEAARQKVNALKARREDLIFAGDQSALASLLAEIRASEGELETQEIALAGAERRKAEAEAREAREHVEAKRADLVKRLGDLREIVKRYHAAAQVVIEAAHEIAAIEEARQTFNRGIAASPLHSDLQVKESLVRQLLAIAEDAKAPEAQTMPMYVRRLVEGMSRPLSGMQIPGVYLPIGSEGFNSPPRHLTTDANPIAKL